MLELLKYSLDNNLQQYFTPGKYYSSTFLHEQALYGSEFLAQQLPDGFEEACTKAETVIHMLVIKVISMRGRAQWEDSWRFEPKLERFTLGFVATSQEEVIANALKFCVENTDHTQEPTRFKNGCFNPTIQPLIVRSSSYPHYLDKKEK